MQNNFFHNVKLSKNTILHNQSEEYLRENLSTYTVCYAKKVYKIFNLVSKRLGFFYSSSVENVVALSFYRSKQFWTHLSCFRGVQIVLDTSKIDFQFGHVSKRKTQ